MHSTPPRLVVTGAAGFLGRRLISLLGKSWQVIAIDRDPPPSALASQHSDVRWFIADINDGEAMARVMAELKRGGGAQALLHLAAHYDFTGEDHVEYRRTNVEGTRALLDLASEIGLERFVFASSLAACEFPRHGQRLDETSPADGTHPYAVSKRAGEELMRSETRFPTCIVRFAALYSDWCEYAPLYTFLGSWLSNRWDSRALGGRGESAVPYLHARDACFFLERVINNRHELEPAEVLLASPNDVASHADLFQAATQYALGKARRPWKVPKPIAALGLVGRDLAGRARGRRPFERPWMAAMIDRRLECDARRTHARLDWAPRARLELLRRLPFLIENMRSDPGTWAARNEAALHVDRLPAPLRIIRLLEEHERAISAAFTALLIADPARFPHYSWFADSEHAWNHRMLLRSLADALRTRHRTAFRTYCQDVGLRRSQQGFPHEEVRSAIQAFERACRGELLRDPRAGDLRPEIEDLVVGTIEFGLDGVDDAYEQSGAASTAAAEGAPR